MASYEVLKKILEDKLAEYNDSNAVMNLVLFQQAMEHVCRIARIIALPRGNAMLVGVGGSGKQSLARLASFICGYDVFQIAVSSTYGVGDFKENLLQLYTKAGMKGQPVTFLLTDNQIVNERFLVFLNDLLATGMVADVFAAEDIENFSNSVRNEVKAAGILETPENLWEFFIEKIRRYHFDPLLVFIITVHQPVIQVTPIGVQCRFKYLVCVILLHSNVMCICLQEPARGSLLLSSG